MRIHRYPLREPTWQCWVFRLLFGPASLLDGIVETLSFGTIGIGCRLAVTRHLAGARIDAARAIRARGQ
jgi:hypothetical protein